MPEDEKINAKSYIQVAMDHLKENPDFYDTKTTDGILIFAKYLDSFKHIGVELQLLAAQQALKIDREIFNEIIKEFGTEKVKIIAQKVNDRHFKHKNKDRGFVSAKS